MRKPTQILAKPGGWRCRLYREQHEVVSDLRRDVVTVTGERKSESVPTPHGNG